MPYIKEEDRIRLEEWIGDCGGDAGLFGALGEFITSAGELNYVFTRLAHAYLASKGLNYQNINDIIGALEGAKLEFYRRVVVPYEEIKIEENGDV